MEWIHGVVWEAEWVDANLPPHKPQAMRDRHLEELERKLQRGMMFTVLLPKESDWHYAGRGVSIGAADTPVFWYRPKDARKYRVICAGLSVQEADAPPQTRVVPIAGMEQDLIDMLRQYLRAERRVLPGLRRTWRRLPRSSGEKGRERTVLKNRGSRARMRSGKCRGGLQSFSRA